MAAERYQEQLLPVAGKQNPLHDPFVVFSQLDIPVSIPIPKHYFKSTVIIIKTTVSEQVNLKEIAGFCP